MSNTPTNPATVGRFAHLNLKRIEIRPGFKLGAGRFAVFTRRELAAYLDRQRQTRVAVAD